MQEEYDANIPRPIHLTFTSGLPSERERERVRVSRA